MRYMRCQYTYGHFGAEQQPRRPNSRALHRPFYLRCWAPFVRDQPVSRLRSLRRVILAAVGAGLCVGCDAPPEDDVDAQRGAVLDICATAPEGALCDDKNVCTVFDVCKA